jgi:hypothetical protein
MGKAIKTIKKLNWLIFALLFPFGYSYILLGKLHRKLATLLNWLFFSLLVIIREPKGKYRKMGIVVL